MSPTIPPSLQKLSSLVGNTQAGLSSAYGNRSIERQVKKLALHSAGPLQATRKHVGAILGVLHEMNKEQNAALEHQIRRGGLHELKQKEILRRINRAIPLSYTQKRETKTLLRSLGAQPRATAVKPARFKNDVTQDSRGAQTSIYNNRATSHVWQTGATAVVQQSGDAVKLSRAGTARSGVAGSVADLTSRRPASPPSSQPGGLGSNFRPVR